MYARFNKFSENLRVIRGVSPWRRLYIICCIQNYIVLNTCCTSCTPRDFVGKNCRSIGLEDSCAVQFCCFSATVHATESALWAKGKHHLIELMCSKPFMCEFAKCTLSCTQPPYRLFLLLAFYETPVQFFSKILLLTDYEMDQNEVQQTHQLDFVSY